MRADGNQKEIVDGLRQAGISVLILSQVGSGCPDLLIGWQGINLLIEVKTETGKLSERQIKFKESWKGRIAVIRSIEEAFEIVNRIR